MKHLHVLIAVCALLVLLPGADSTAFAALGTPSPPQPMQVNDQARPTASPGAVGAAALPTRTIDKFGVSFVTGGMAQGLRPQAAALAAEAGLAWSREDMHWLYIETSPGVYNFSDRDNAVDALVANNRQIVGNFVYTPQFYSSNPTAQNFHTYPPTSQAGLDAWARFVTATVNRYKDRIHVWQVWHSIDDPSVWAPFPGQTEYLALMQRAYPALKAADPTATLIMAGGRPSWTIPFLNIGGGTFFDAFALTNYSIYDNPSSPTTPIPEASRLTSWRLALVKDMQRRYAPTKPIYVTEYDWASVPPNKQVINETDQAAYLIRSLLLQEAVPSVAGVFWGFYVDGNGANYGMLLHDNLTKKLSFNAYKAMTTALAGATFSVQNPSPSTSVQALENFEGSQAYVVNPFGGAIGSFTKTAAVAHSGSFSGQVNYQWSQPSAVGLNVQPSPTLEIAVTGTPSRVSAWAKGDGGPAVVLSFAFTDATNRFCTGQIGIVSGTEWKQYTLYLDAPNAMSSLVTCSGVDGINIAFPIKFNGFQVGGTEDASQTANGVVWIDDINFESGPSIFDLQYTAPTGTVHALWSLQGTPNFALQTGGATVTVRDWTNATSTIPVVNGVATIPLSYHPVFVTGASTAELCSDRPRVAVSVSKTAPNTLVATIRPGTSRTLLSNQLQSIQVGSPTNATVDLGTRSNVTSSFTETFAVGTSSATMTIRRTSGSGGATVPLAVTDSCGTWRTFVGGGASAF